MKLSFKNIVRMVKAVKKAEIEVEQEEKPVEVKTFHANVWDFLIQLVKMKEFWLTMGALFGGGWFVSSRSGNSRGDEHRKEMRQNFHREANRDSLNHSQNNRR